MTTRIARLETDRAGRYPQQLCRHFGQKVPVEWSATEGLVELPFGSCGLRADGTALHLTVEGASDDIPRLERCVAEHLARFAFRENPTLTWTPQKDGGSI
ncbi:MAG: DUF2218 domain-containing protein [Pseudomonadota bacterium]